MDEIDCCVYGIVCRVSWVGIYRVPKRRKVPLDRWTVKGEDTVLWSTDYKLTLQLEA